MAVESGEIVSITGASGSGKSTLIKTIAGIEMQDEGQIEIYGKQVNNPVQRRGLFGYMAQQDALLPWRNLLDNVILGSEIAGVDANEAKQQAYELLPLFGLAGREKSMPATLSGGMKRRAALMRTWLMGEDLLLLDEPFNGLDNFIQQELQAWLLKLQQQLNKTIVFVTHDLEEAIKISSRVLVLATGKRIVHEELVDHNNHNDASVFRHKNNILSAMSKIK